MTENTKKILYISHSVLTKSLMHHYSIDKMLQNYSFQFWDIGKLFRVDYEIGDRIEGDYIQKINDFSQFESMLKNLDSSTIVFTDIPPNYLFRNFFRLLRNYSFCLINLDIVIIGPIGFTKKTIYSRLINVCKNPPRYLRLVSSIIHMNYLFKFEKLKKYDFTFCRGEKIYQSSLPHSAKKKIAINASDYDYFLRETLNPSESDVHERKFVVFLDTYLPYHADHSVMGLPYLSSPDNYFRDMAALFDLVEQKYDVEVIVAAHPSANYSGMEFGERKIIQGMTQSLVKNCEFVIKHHSQSISYAVLYQKPILFCYTDEMFEKYHNSILSHQNNYAQYLEIKTYNVSELLSKGLPDVYKCISVSRYENFVNDFLTTRVSQNSLSEDIIINVIDSI
jgi:hypothetical protein